ncbi:sulfite exporter TauE/SafE family protein [Vulcanisaeta souniana]|uniref:Probable membrane transporter protein n=1 Tax=Vulcanisaeta souniana JCM 11219 TaxID=1293586 RepID=A0A830E9K5_9CREN|nr:sulfite exporter TauE/SafE family protein [Vulcanisaeta souniana]BDR92558.1 anion permease [Vulcanisaeta souniana JCM 11219]GGI82939.1 anion permease [Vulcanisaeta souniana JCM 11219]
MAVIIALMQYVLSIVSGILVGFSLGLIGGGGSILAVPLFLYFVGLDTVPDAAHIAIGTTALAVGLNAYINSYMHLRKKNVAPRVGGIFAGVGLAGSLIGAYLGHITPGTDLLTYFAIAMIVLGIYMAIRRESTRAGTVDEVNHVVNAFQKCPRLTTSTILKVAIFGFIVGLVSGYFGIGGGFLIVPSLMFSAGLCITRAIGTSLISVGTFGVASGAEYWYYGDVLILIALLYVAGGVVGGYAGTSLAVKVPKSTLRIAYGAIIVLVGIYMLMRVYHIIP